MSKLLSIFSFILMSCTTTLKSDDPYLKLIKNNQELGPHEGPLEILTDPNEIALAQRTQHDFVLKKGIHPDFAGQASRIGILSIDPFWIIVRDAVRFPGGHLGAHLRLISSNAVTKKSGSIVLAVNEKNEIALIKNFRHSSRSWEYELPRGAAEKGEKLIEAAKRELKEETGLNAEQLIHLGEVTEAISILASVPDVFFCKVKTTTSDLKLDRTEAIESLEWFSPAKIKEAFKRGSSSTLINGKQQQVPFRDPFISHAIMLAVSKGYLDFKFDEK